MFLLFKGNIISYKILLNNVIKLLNLKRLLLYIKANNFKGIINPLTGSYNFNGLRIYA